MANKALETSFYLVLSGRKERAYTWRTLKAQRIIQRTDSLPKLGKDEIAVRVTVSVPAAMFERPELSIKIDVTGELPRVEIDAETQDNLAARVQEMLGLPVRVELDLPEE